MSVIETIKSAARSLFDSNAINSNGQHISYLKIKIVSLADEARAIRREQAKHPKPSAAWQGLHHHRTRDIRREARAAQLAYGFLRGREYRQMEHSCYEQPNWGRIAALAKKYGNEDPNGLDNRIAEWRLK